MRVEELISNPFLLLSVCIFFGQLLGKVEIKGIKLGSSGGLFVGLALSYLLKGVIYPRAGLESLMAAPLIDNNLFQLSLIGFISAVGLMAAPEIRRTIRTYGITFLLLGLVIPLVGAVSTWLFKQLLSEQYGTSVVGTYVGALTSSPGLAAAIEAAKKIDPRGEALVGMGYSIAYIPGVLTSATFSRILGKGEKGVPLSAGVAGTSTASPASGNLKNSADSTDQNASFPIAAFALVCLAGVLLGMVPLPLGKQIGTMTLGSAGGVLISGLFFGDRGRLFSLRFSFHPQSLNAVKEISLNLFLSIVGLNYGYTALSLLREAGLPLLVAGALTGVASFLAGYIIGGKLFKLPKASLLGGICGGMTSTPGLAAAMETTGSTETVTAYGATYPFGLLFKVIFVNLLLRL